MTFSEIRYTVVITAYNEERHIANTIRALSDQIDLEAGALEILLVDDGSTDATVAEARASGSQDLIILHNADASHSSLTTRQQALDLGFRRARGGIILTMDADGRPGRDWVCRMIRPIVDGRVDAVAGPIAFASRPGWISAWQSCDVSYYLLVSMMVARAGFAGGILFGNFAFRASLYREAGGFEAMGFALTEDLLFAKAIRARGGKVAYGNRECLVEFSPCPTFRSLVERTVRVSSGKFSMLTAVLTAVPLSLLCALLAALFLGAAAWAVLAVRYVLGVALVMAALWKSGKLSIWPAAFVYEPAVFVIAPAVLAHVYLQGRVAWGRHSYGR